MEKKGILTTAYYIDHSSSRLKRIKTIFGHHLLAIDVLFLLLAVVLMAGMYLYYNFLPMPQVISPMKQAMIENKGTFLLQKAQVALPAKKRREVVGFLPSWTVANEQTIHTKNLTQLIYFGLSVNSDGSLVKYATGTTPVLEWHYFTDTKFQALVKDAINRDTKIIMAIKNFDNKSIDTLISSKAATVTFITQLQTLMQQYQLDGINLDLEYVTDSSFPTSQYLNGFLETVTKAIKQQNPQAIISIDVNATAVMQDRAYDMAKIGSIVDFIILMAYDYHQASSTRAGAVAPLFAQENQHSINNSVQSLIGRVDPEKIILAVPFYGYEWETLGNYYHSPTVPSSGALATYQRVEQLLAHRDDIEKHWDEKAQSPWLTYVQSGAIKTIYYEDPKSFAAKVAYAEEKKLGGICVWALGYEGETTALWDVLGQ